MAMTLGTRGDGGKSLVRNKKAFDQNFDDIVWKSKRPAEVPAEPKEAPKDEATT